MKISKILALIAVAGLLYCPLCDNYFEGEHDCPNAPTTLELEPGPF